MKPGRIRVLSIASGLVCTGVLAVGAVRYREFGGLYYHQKIQSNPGLLPGYLAAPDDSFQARGSELYLRSPAGRSFVRRALIDELIRVLRARGFFEESTAALVAVSGDRLLFRFRSEDGIHAGGSWKIRARDPSGIPALAPRLSALCGLVFPVDEPCVSVSVLPFEDALCRFGECSRSPFSSWDGDACLYIEVERE